MMMMPKAKMSSMNLKKAIDGQQPLRPTCIMGHHGETDFFLRCRPDPSSR